MWHIRCPSIFRGRVFVGLVWPPDHSKVPTLRKKKKRFFTFYIFARAQQRWKRFTRLIFSKNFAPLIINCARTYFMFYVKIQTGNRCCRNRGHPTSWKKKKKWKKRRTAYTSAAVAGWCSRYDRRRYVTFTSTSVLPISGNAIFSRGAATNTPPAPLHLWVRWRLLCTPQNANSIFLHPLRCFRRYLSVARCGFGRFNAGFNYVKLTVKHIALLQHANLLDTIFV